MVGKENEHPIKYSVIVCSGKLTESSKNTEKSENFRMRPGGSRAAGMLKSLRKFFEMTTFPVSTTSPIAEFKNKIQLRQARVAIIGIGYVGLPLALLYTEQKFRVTGFDIDQRKVTTLSQGGSYIARILPTEIQQARVRGFEATSDYAQLADMDAIIICVPTPLKEITNPALASSPIPAKPFGPIPAPVRWVSWKSTPYL